MRIHTTIVLIFVLEVMGLMTFAVRFWFHEQKLLDYQRREFLTRRAEREFNTDSLKVGDSSEKVKNLFPDLAGQIVNGKGDLEYYIPTQKEADPDYPHSLGLEIKIYIRDEKVTYIKRKRCTALSK